MRGLGRLERPVLSKATGRGGTVQLSFGGNGQVDLAGRPALVQEVGSLAVFGPFGGDHAYRPNPIEEVSQVSQVFPSLSRKVWRGRGCGSRRGGWVPSVPKCFKCLRASQVFPSATSGKCAKFPSVSSVCKCRKCSQIFQVPPSSQVFQVFASVTSVCNCPKCPKCFHLFSSVPKCAKVSQVPSSVPRFPSVLSGSSVCKRPKCSQVSQAHVSQYPRVPSLKCSKCLQVSQVFPSVPSVPAFPSVLSVSRCPRCKQVFQVRTLQELQGCKKSRWAMLVSQVFPSVFKCLRRREGSGAKEWQIHLSGRGAAPTSAAMGGPGRGGFIVMERGAAAAPI